MRSVGLVRNVMLGREGLDRVGLVRLVEEAGGADVGSHLVTGNVTFTTTPAELEQLVDTVEQGLEDVLRRHELFAVRDLDWLRRFVEADPFTGFDEREWELEVAFLSHRSPSLDRANLGEPRRTVLVNIGDRELVAARPRHGPDRPHVNRLLEAATGEQATARGWSTLQRVAAKG